MRTTRMLLCALAAGAGIGCSIVYLGRWQFIIGVLIVALAIIGWGIARDIRRPNTTRYRDAVAERYGLPVDNRADLSDVEREWRRRESAWRNRDPDSDIYYSGRYGVWPFSAGAPE